MFNRGMIQRQIAVFAAALLMSSIAVGTAIAPATSAVSPFVVTATYA